MALEMDDWNARWNEAGELFSPGAPIDEQDLFAGRVDQLRELLGAVSQRGQHAIIFGERGVGKTSLSNTFTAWMHSPRSKVVAHRVNCDGMDSFTSVWRKALADLDIGADLPDPCSPDDVRRTLRQVALNHTLIIVLDKFDRLPRNGVTTLIADTIKGLSDHSVAATIVLVGVADSVSELLAEHASVGRAMVEIPMPRMDDEELDEIISKRLSKLGMKIADRTKSRIVELSQGLPHYTHLITLNAVRAAIDRRSMSILPSDLQTAIGRCIDKAQQSIRDLYYKATVSPRKDNLFKEVLLSCAMAPTDDMGFFTAASVAEPMSDIMSKTYTVASFGQHLKDFCSDGRGNILEQRGTPRKYRYRFKDPLMQPFVTLQGIRSGMVPDRES